MRAHSLMRDFVLTWVGVQTPPPDNEDAEDSDGEGKSGAIRHANSTNEGEGEGEGEATTPASSPKLPTEEVRSPRMRKRCSRAF